jgi:hypothetical protein
MDGYEVARHRRGDRRGSGEAGFDRHMTKPGDREELRAVLSRGPVHG